MLIDFHSHILPKMDDGSRSVAESIEMLKAEAEQGVTHVVCTPHFYARHDRPEDFFCRRKESYNRLQNEMAKYSDLPDILLGAEVYYFRGMASSDVLPQLTIGNTPYLMVEMPQGSWQPSVYEELLQIRRNWNIIPIVAHIDRYIAPLRTHGIPDKLAKLPVLVQANAEFFYDRRTYNMAMRMLKSGKIHLLGSDCHNMESRKPDLREAAQIIEDRLGKEPLHRIYRDSCEILGLPY